MYAVPPTEVGSGNVSGRAAWEIAALEASLREATDHLSAVLTRIAKTEAAVDQLRRDARSIEWSASRSKLTAADASLSSGAVSAAPDLSAIESLRDAVAEVEGRISGTHRAAKVLQEAHFQASREHDTTVSTLFAVRTNARCALAMMNLKRDDLAKQLDDLNCVAAFREDSMKRKVAAFTLKDTTTGGGGGEGAIPKNNSLLLPARSSSRDWCSDNESAVDAWWSSAVNGAATSTKQHHPHQQQPHQSFTMDTLEDHYEAQMQRVREELQMLHETVEAQRLLISQLEDESSLNVDIVLSNEGETRALHLRRTQEALRHAVECLEDEFRLKRCSLDEVEAELCVEGNVVQSSIPAKYGDGGSDRWRTTQQQYLDQYDVLRRRLLQVRQQTKDVVQKRIANQVRISRVLPTTLSQTDTTKRHEAAQFKESRRAKELEYADLSIALKDMCDKYVHVEREGAMLDAKASHAQKEIDLLSKELERIEALSKSFRLAVHSAS